MPLPLQCARRKRQRVPNALTRNPDITTCTTPLRPMRFDSPVSRPLVGNEMSKLMEIGSLHLVLRDVPQSWIQFHHRIRPGRPPRGGTHARIPLHSRPARQGTQTKLRTHLAGTLRHAVITTTRNLRPPKPALLNLIKRKLQLQDRLLHAEIIIASGPKLKTGGKLKISSYRRLEWIQSAAFTGFETAGGSTPSRGR